MQRGSKEPAVSYGVEVEGSSGGRLRSFARARPVLAYWSLAMLFAVLLFPFIIVIFLLYPNLPEALARFSRLPLSNMALTLGPALEIPGGMALWVFSYLQPATPLFAALVVAYLAGRGRLRALVSRYRFWSAEVGWRRGLAIWAAALGTMVLVKLAVAAVFGYNDGLWSGWSFLADPLAAAFWFALLTSLFLDGGGLFEETGWRGFAQPELQKRLAPLGAAIVVGVLWSFWHVPIKLDQHLAGTPADFLAFYAGFTLYCIAFSILVAYFFNLLGGSIFVAVAMHGLLNDSARLAGDLTAIPLTINYFVQAAVIMIPVFFILWLDGARLGVGSVGKRPGAEVQRPPYNAPAASKTPSSSA